MTKVKICGITNLEDASIAAKFGADALGFNFYEKSPRFIAPEKAREIIEQMPPEILKVGVFVNESLENIVAIAAAAKLDALQLHGEETPEFVRELKARTGLKIIKAFRISPEFKPEDVRQYETDAILLDGYSPKEHGGTGVVFDWKIATEVQAIFPKIYLAGGLKLENVSASIDGVFPYFIDVCSGIEKEKGKKDRVKTINLLKIAKFEYKKDIENIYDFCWALHPNLIGIRIGVEKLSRLDDFITNFRFGLFYASNRSKDFDWEPFFSRFYKSRICKVSGVVADSSLSENHVEFDEFVLNKYGGRNRKQNDWVEAIIENNGGDTLESLYVFYALLEEYRIDYDNLTL
jgi:phosphoribosylanthranilate isomerase